MDDKPLPLIFENVQMMLFFGIALSLVTAAAAYVVFYT